VPFHLSLLRTLKRFSRKVLLGKSINFVIIQLWLKPAKCNKHFTWTARFTYIPRRISRLTRWIRTKYLWNVTPCGLLNMSQTVLKLIVVRLSVLYISVNIYICQKCLDQKLLKKFKKNTAIELHRWNVVVKILNS